MSQPKTKHSPPDDTARMEDAKQRLEDLLRNPGPGITIVPVDHRDQPETEADVEETSTLAADLPTSAKPGETPSLSNLENFLSSDGRAAALATAIASHASLPSESPAPQKATPAADTPVVETRAKKTERPSKPTIAPETAASKAETTFSSDVLNKDAALSAPLRLPTQHGELGAAIRESYPAFGSAALFSCIINLLMLAGPIFMLQVYDRVLASGSVPTLVALFAMTALMFAVVGLLELCRSRLFSRIGAELDQRLSGRVFQAAAKHSLINNGRTSPALRELDQIRQFLSSSGPSSFFDAPWAPIYLGVIFLLHWQLGVAATIGALLLMSLAIVSDYRSRGPLEQARKASAKSLEIAESSQRNSEAMTAMGMLSSYRQRWQVSNYQALAWQVLASDRLGSITAITKSLRLTLQSLVLALGAYLAINGEISAGAIVAATIIFGRALAPVEQAIAHWRNFLKTRQAAKHLDLLLQHIPSPKAATKLPRPSGAIVADKLSVAAPESENNILKDLSFDLNPGDMLAVIGPSASGKSTLARALVGLWQPKTGGIKLDGARVEQWDNEDLGQHIGYLPQNVELFSGTIRDNISRFQSDATDADIVAAAKQAHAHDLILNLQNGYETEVGSDGTYLSGGQRQRIALARALFGNPSVVVLDEPNANLDRVGDEALSAALDGMKKRSQTIVLVSHRLQAIKKADKLLYIDKGVQRAFGDRDDVMQRFKTKSETKA